jgi:hypothetical protein
MAGGDLFSLVSDLESAGVFYYLLPFLLVFVMVFAILEKTKLFGTDTEGNTKTSVNAIIGLILGLLVASQWEILDKMRLFLPKMSLVIVIFVMMLILIGIMGVPVQNGAKGIFALVLGIGSLVGLYWSLGPDFDLRVPYWVVDNQGTIMLVTIVMIIIYVIVMSGKSKAAHAGGGSAFDKMHDFFGLPR